MNYINLTLKRLNKKDNEPQIDTLNKAIENDKLIVVLGSPGSGKTSLLKKYHEDHKDTSQVLTIKKIIKLNCIPSSDTEVVLLDGLDEYRSTSEDKAFVMEELGSRIHQLLQSSTVVISCREMDWYGETDVAALKNEVNMEAILYTIQALNDDQQKKLAALKNVKDIDAFISKFGPLGLLGNPQMFIMLSQIYKEKSSEDISTKTDLYFTFIKMAREQNPNYKRNKINTLEPNEILQYAGYLAFYYIFTDIDAFDADFLDQISESDAGYMLERLETTINTSLFNEAKFIHRTIAEFALANFLKDYKLGGKAIPGIALSRVKSLFVRNSRIPTELRGTYAWLCSLTKSNELIAVDPYYQVIHGDNSTFDLDLKRKVVVEVKKYSQNVNPYFFRHDGVGQMEGFYFSQLDDFLIEEYEEAKNLKNHYIYFLNNIISSATAISDSMRGFVKEFIQKPNISCYYKRDLLDIFEDEPDFLIDVLNLVKDNKIKDDRNALLENLLNRLYPKYIGLGVVTDYLKLYSDKVFGHCFYLFKTDYVDKYKLIDKIHKNSFDESREPKLQLPEDVKTFIDDYFLETLLEYKISLTAKEIFDILKHFKDYYDEYEHLEFSSYRNEITDKLPANEKKLQDLTNKLFEIYVDDVLSKESDNISFFMFHYLYGYKNPTNQGKVILNRINSKRSQVINRQLFLNALRYYSKEKISSGEMRKMQKIAGQFGLETDLNNFLHPQKTPWEIKNEERKKKKEESDQQILEKNEKHFAERTDADILGSFGDLYFISMLKYWKEVEHERSLKPKTYDKLKKVLKRVILEEIVIDSELLNLESLAKTSPCALRSIDKMYYVACCLNNWEKIEFKDDEFYKYLFINALMHDGTALIKKSNLVEQVTSKYSKLVLSIIKEYIDKLCHEYLPEQASLLLRYITDVDDIYKLKELVLYLDLANSEIKDEFLCKFLKVFNFTISLEDLNSLQAVASNEKNKHSISALKAIAEDNKPAFDINMAIAIHSLFSLEYNEESFEELDISLKVQLIDYMFNQFNTAESIEFVNGFQSPKDSCASFLRDHALNSLTLDGLKKLQKVRKDKNDIWTDRITHMINEKGQQDIDRLHTSLKLKRIKDFIISDAIVSSEDFFIDVCDKLNKLKEEIEDNRDNDKDSFYNQDRTQKIEEACRDVIFYRLKDRYKYDLTLAKEKHEADNRVDINIKYNANNNFEVQIECKRDDNQELYKGISKQLIKKYLSSGVQYAIYLIFYFGNKKNWFSLQKGVKSISVTNMRLGIQEAKPFLVCDSKNPLLYEFHGGLAVISEQKRVA